MLEMHNVHYSSAFEVKQSATASNDLYIMFILVILTLCYGLGFSLLHIAFIICNGLLSTLALSRKNHQEKMNLGCTSPLQGSKSNIVSFIIFVYVCTCACVRERAFIAVQFSVSWFNGGSEIPVRSRDHPWIAGRLCVSVSVFVSVFFDLGEPGTNCYVTMKERERREIKDDR